MTFATSTLKNPRHLTIYEGEITEELFTIDQLATFNISTVDANDLPNYWEINNPISGRPLSGARVALDANSPAYAYFVWQDYSATSSYVYLQR